MTNIFNGKKVAEEMLAELKKQTAKMPFILGLAAISVGDVGGVKKFVQVKKKAAEKIGVQFSSYELAENATCEEIKEVIDILARDKDVHGILIELPLPKHLDTQKVLDLVPIKKDVDVLASGAQKKFYAGEFEILPPAVEAVKVILENYFVTNGPIKDTITHEHEPISNQDASPHHDRVNMTTSKFLDFSSFLKGRVVSVFGQGMLVGKPVTHWLESHGATAHRIDEFIKNPSRFSLVSDIVVSGAGEPGIINGDMVQEGAIVIDFGFKNGKGDVDFDSVLSKASLVTPTPGGTGPLVVVAVLKNLVKLAS